MRHPRCLIAVAIFAMAHPAIASAESGFDLPALLAGPWTVTVGAHAQLMPDFEGAKRYMINPVPDFAIRRAGTPRNFRSPRDGASLSLIDAGGFHFGPVAKLKPGYRAGDFRELNGLGDRPWALEAGVFAEYWVFDWLRTRAEVRHGFGGHHGIVADLTADVVMPVSPRWTLSAGPRFTLADTKAISPYFGITAAQAASSGLPVFNATGGAHAVGAGAQAVYQLTRQWELFSFVEYDRLLGGAAASPLVVLRGSPDQVTAGMGATYSFDIRFW